MKILSISDSKDGSLIGFSAFNFSFEETSGEFDIPVLYCYEIHIRDKNGGSGLGLSLLSCMEIIGKSNQMKKIMLTSFKGNHYA
ncbi:N-alpha-acetyltransferase 40 [Smittium mucronatum]|uniref:N-alpha-acetyltransferase 40 n=1 Tax=Smittium mucronatum TaxID=133383 RepID=A0A1R0GZK8_9FUNG|nr:N-alpha-acetyltransferase 40 [Smittium mucronatum]